MKIDMVADACKAKGKTSTMPSMPSNGSNGTSNGTYNGSSINGTTGGAVPSSPVSAADVEATCKAATQCTWDATASECDISAAATMTAMGASSSAAMSTLQKSIFTCALSVGAATAVELTVCKPFCV
jgi:hypothetical protein